MPGREGDLMDVNEAIVARHSVRRYTTRPIGDDAVGRLRAAIDEANEASGLSIQLVRNEPDAFSNPLKTLGQFRNVSTYLAFVAPEGGDQDELVGYYGEGIILLRSNSGSTPAGWEAPSTASAPSIAQTRDRGWRSWRRSAMARPRASRTRSARRARARE